MPSDFSLKAMTGRKSGEKRTAMLTAPAMDGPGYVIVASRGGDDRHPACS